MQRRAKQTSLANMNVNVTGCSGVELEVGELSMFGGLQEHHGFLPLCGGSQNRSPVIGVACKEKPGIRGPN